MAEPTNAFKFEAKLLRPGGKFQGATWAFFRLPQEVSNGMPSRGMVSVHGNLNGVPILATLEPDGEGGHWLRVKDELLEAMEAKPGDSVTAEIAPSKVDPEPEVPSDLKEALDMAPPKALETWGDITPAARRDYVAWIVSGKKVETRQKRIGVAIDKLSKGNRRPCCFDRSGIYSKEFSCPIADDE